MNSMRRSVLLASFMGVASVAAFAMKPRARAADKGKAIDLETMVPKQFGNWVMVDGSAHVVNPQAKALLDKLYSQLLGRTYVNAQGYRVMLSLAYGDDQRGSLEAHKPEVCYPSQGFTLHQNQPATVITPFGDIGGRHLFTSMGARKEPITYWFAVGERSIRNRWDKRMSELRLALTGQIPDGLLFRVSSIDADPEHGWQMQQTFVADLLSAVPKAARARLAGVPN